jgi:hypothetical protein
MSRSQADGPLVRRLEADEQSSLVLLGRYVHRRQLCGAASFSSRPVAPSAGGVKQMAQHVAGERGQRVLAARASEERRAVL